jgi:hypothetical protein
VHPAHRERARLRQLAKISWTTPLVVFALSFVFAQALGNAVGVFVWGAVILVLLLLAFGCGVAALVMLGRREMEEVRTPAAVGVGLCVLMLLWILAPWFT